MKRLLLVTVLTLLSCTDEGASRRTLDANGFTDITFHGYVSFACSEDDEYSTGFTATNAKGHRVRGVVCCGLLKNCTLRF